MQGTPDRTLAMKDEWTLVVAEYGEHEGTPILLFHGTPGSRLEGGSLSAPRALRHEKSNRRVRFFPALARTLCEPHPGFWSLRFLYLGPGRVRSLLKGCEKDLLLIAARPQRVRKARIVRASMDEGDRCRMLLSEMFSLGWTARSQLRSESFCGSGIRPGSRDTDNGREIQATREKRSRGNTTFPSPSAALVRASRSRVCRRASRCSLRASGSSCWARSRRTRCRSAESTPEASRRCSGVWATSYTRRSCSPVITFACSLREG